MTRVAAPPTRIFNTVTGFICRRGERRIVTVSPASWRLSCARVRPLRDPLVGEARSYERLLPASLGGRKRTSKALSRRCNSTTGHDWDAELERQHRPIALFVFPPHHPCARKHRRVADAEGNHLILKAGIRGGRVPAPPARYRDGCRALTPRLGTRSPLQTSSTIWRWYSGAYGGRLFDIWTPSLRNVQVSHRVLSLRYQLARAFTDFRR